MNELSWSKVDDFFVDTLVDQDEVLLAALAANSEANLPAIDVSPAEGKLLHIYARMMGAKRILEIGTLGGYSTIWLAKALPEDGKVITLEFEPRHAEIAAKNIRHAGLESRVTILVGPALESLPKLASSAPFDLIFIDADKKNNPAYLEWALKYSRQGTVIIGDNVVRSGRVADENNQDENVAGLREFLQRQGQEKRLTATAIQTVGAKGWDGFSVAIVD
ncbi:O-methyltransferase [Kalamiella sp. sgz302252]|uniref:O-methyltransferase n=1 Tax=Pantoea sp. sgz302252 TaxID=3341827 RepID=UPI0036D2FC38